jgi:hypothetical protein
MKKKVVALLLAVAMVSSMSVGFAAVTASATEMAEPEFDPNPDYDKYTVVEYTIEAINADLVATVSAKEDDSEFEILCNFYGDDQKAVVTYDGSEYTVTEDLTGFMGTDSQPIIEAALEQDNWLPIGEDGATEIVDFGVEPEFDPNPDYDIYTVLEYTIEAINADMVVTISAKEDYSEYEILCNFYGDDQKAVVTYDADKDEYEVTEDLTGFMGTDSQPIIEAALEKDLWAKIGEETEGADKTNVEPEFDPNPDYDKYTVVEYTIEAINADLVATVSAKEDDSEFEILCNFYGDDQKAVVTYDGSEYTVTEDLTGFMGGDAQPIIEAALAQTDWVSLK